MEQRAVDQPEKPRAFEAINERAVVTFTHYRRRLADPDGFATKWMLDGIVDLGLLRDDSANEIEEVRHRQVKVEAWEQERVVVTISTMGDIDR